MYLQVVKKRLVTISVILTFNENGRTITNQGPGASWGFSYARGTKEAATLLYTTGALIEVSRLR